MYILAPIRHIQAVRSWAQARAGRATLDLESFELEVKARHRGFRLYPQFLCNTSGAMRYSPSLGADYAGFVGWLPYRPLRWPLAADKPAFKRFLRSAGLCTPADWADPASTTSNYVLKQPSGSFGQGIAGPFRAFDASHAFQPSLSSPTLFAEEFIDGDILKLWFWGETPFHAHLHARPTIVGDGVRSAEFLLRDRLGQLSQELGALTEIEAIRSALAYQEVAIHDVIAHGRAVWLDFRYGRRLAQSPQTEAEDNDLPRIADGLLALFRHVGRVVSAELRKQVTAPVLYAMDGVLDSDGRVWWLEMNSNPQLPATGYPHILDTLFGPAETLSGAQQASGEEHAAAA
jgi:hypothetical protein